MSASALGSSGSSSFQIYVKSTSQLMTRQVFSWCFFLTRSQRRGPGSARWGNHTRAIPSRIPPQPSRTTRTYANIRRLSSASGPGAVCFALSVAWLCSLRGALHTAPQNTAVSSAPRMAPRPRMVISQHHISFIFSPFRSSSLLSTPLSRRIDFSLERAHAAGRGLDSMIKNVQEFPRALMSVRSSEVTMP